MLAKEKLSVAFVVGEFPVVSETFVINQITDLIDSGVDVQIFSFRKGTTTFASEKYSTYRLADRVVYLSVPKNIFVRVPLALRTCLFLLVKNPGVLLRALDVRKHGAHAQSLSTLFWTTPFLDKHFDLVHCHFGTVANRYLIIRDILRHTQKMITTFYGNDVSYKPSVKGSGYYTKLKEQGDHFIVMSRDMKDRVIALGFPDDKISILPISLDIDSLQFSKRVLKQGEPVELVSVGRFVEKKGFDDLLRALAIVKEKTQKRFHATIIGGGVLEGSLKEMVRELNIADVVTFPGYMKIEEILETFQSKHIYVQPSKTAADGDME